MDYVQGDIFWVNIPKAHTVGSEQYDPRPFIIVSRDAVNKVLKTVVVVPMSTNVSNQPPYRIVIPPTEITRDVSYTRTLVLSVAKTDQVRVIDKTRLLDRVGRLSQTATISVLIGVAYVFNIR
jgi:mRNA interferase MazF